MDKNTLKDKLADDHLDLSLCNYSEKHVPVKDIALLKRATSVDLSNNRLSGLPTSFASLTHLVKLDLSCNAVIELPANFGQLKRLRHLDLYNNKLTHLPVSFDQLGSLRWLDLKKNPLSEQLERAAGSCLNQRECEQCARSVVAFMARVRVRVDEERTRKEQLAQDARNAQLASEEMDKERLRQEKKAKKEKKKQDYRDCKREERVVSDDRDTGDNDVFTKRGSDVSADQRQGSRRTSAQVGRSCMYWMNMLLLLVAVLLAGSVLYVHSSGADSSSSIGPLLQRMSDNLRTLRQIVEVRGVEWLGRGSAGLMWCTRLGGQLGDRLVEAAVELFDCAGLQLATARRSAVGRQLVDWLVRFLELGPLAVTHAGRLALQLFELHAPSLQLLVQQLVGQLTTGTQAAWLLVRAETPRYLQLAGQKVQQLAASLTG